MSGQEIVRDIENQKVNDNHAPYAEVRITHCGELVKKSKQDKPKETSKEKSKNFSVPQDGPG